MIQPSVIYRDGPLTEADYNEAIERLCDAMSQLTPDAGNCAVCHDSGHHAQECHHNALVMARCVVRSEDCWRCYHCNEVFYDHASAEAHFGKTERETVACVASPPPSNAQ